MRYLGNKESLADEIKYFMAKKIPMRKEYTFFDAFSGTGAVAKVIAGSVGKIIVNDSLECSAWYAKSNIEGNVYNWESLGFDPIDYLNNSDAVSEGFIYKNYAPLESGRMYFTNYNAKRIDYVRGTIDTWYEDNLIDVQQRHYLISCLVEAVSKVSNVAGVYGAYLKKWDLRAHKKLHLSHFPPNTESVDVEVKNSFLETIISSVECDILYLDPPYTQNQYGTQYHLLETISKYDSPEISRITGSRPTGPMRSDWSKDIKAHILFEYILSQTKANHVFLSYSSDGLMSKDYIMSCLKRHCVDGTIDLKVIPYKNYSNWKNKPRKNHEEYIFYGELKKSENIRYQSPLNYTGNKFNIIDEIIESLPTGKMDTFVDVFGGGFNVGINIEASSLIYNDINPFVVSLIESFKKYDTYEYIKYIRKLEKQYNLLDIDSGGYAFLREKYNSTPIPQRDPRMLFVLIMYGFNQQIRFNSAMEFNNPIGMRWFNDRMLEKFISFSRRIKQSEVKFFSNDYSNLIKYPFSGNPFYYFDPPYLLTTGSYNDGSRGFKGWNKKLEVEFFDVLTGKLGHSRWMLSYVDSHKGIKNDYFINWLNNHSFKIYKLDGIRGHAGSRRNELLVMNYHE